MTPLASWAFLAILIAPIVLCCWLLWPARSPRPGASVASSAARRGGDTEDRATFVFRAVEAKRTRLTGRQRRARRRSLAQAVLTLRDVSEGGADWQGEGRLAPPSVSSPSVSTDPTRLPSATPTRRHHPSRTPRAVTSPVTAARGVPRNGA